MGYPPVVEYVARGDKLKVTFEYESAAVAAVRGISGSRAVPPQKGGWYWTVPATMQNAHKLREIFGKSLLLHQTARDWGSEAKAIEERRAAAHQAQDADLLVLPNVNPPLHDWLGNRPFQKADVAVLSMSSLINANDPGAGKTTETIAAIIEAELDDRWQLIIAPRTSLRTVWQRWFQHWGFENVVVMHGEDIEAAREARLNERTGVLITTAAGIRAWFKQAPQEFAACSWGAIVVDEFHQLGLGNNTSQLSKALQKAKSERRWATSGTPAGGKPLRLFAALQFVRPDIFTSKWKWSERWLESEYNRYARTGKTFLNKIRPGLEEEFTNEHSRWIIRRTSEEMTGLKMPEPIEVICEMTPKQRKQYKIMERETEITIERETLSADEQLALWTRLRTFAFSCCTIEKVNKVVKRNGREIKLPDKLHPGLESGKLPFLMERLAERGIAPGDEAWGDQCAIVASQFSSVCRVVYEYLLDQGIPAAIIDGQAGDEERAEADRAFNAREVRVIVLSTQAGGVSLTLESAESIHMLDETWNPDDQRQVIGRAHARGRNHKVDVYLYRSEGTIEEYVNLVNIDKTETNKILLAVRNANA